MARWQQLNEPVRPFRLADTSGKVWDSAKLDKKYVIFVWATWSAPSVMELKRFAELHEQLAERQDVLMLGFNVDEDQSAAKEYAESHPMPFPTVLAQVYMNIEVRNLSVPRIWIVSPKLTLEWEKIGFDASSKNYAEDIVSKLGLGAAS